MSNFIVTHCLKSLPYAEAVKHNISRDPIEADPLDLANPLQGDGCDAPGLTWMADAWFEQHDATDQPALREVAQKVKFISEEHFKDKLKSSCDDVAHQLNPLYGNGFNFKKHTVCLVEGGKSNKWVAELALKTSKVESYAYARLGDKQAKIICTIVGRK